MLRYFSDVISKRFFAPARSQVLARSAFAPAYDGILGLGISARVLVFKVRTEWQIACKSEAAEAVAKQLASD